MRRTRPGCSPGLFRKGGSVPQQSQWMLGWGFCSQWRSSALFLKNRLISAAVVVSIPPLNKSQADVPFLQREGGDEDNLKVNVLLVCLSASCFLLSILKLGETSIQTAPSLTSDSCGSPWLLYQLFIRTSKPPGRRWSLWSSSPSSPRHLHLCLYSAFGSSSPSHAGSADPDPLLGLCCVCSPALRFPQQLCLSRRVGVPGEDVSSLPSCRLFRPFLRASQSSRAKMAVRRRPTQILMSKAAFF